MKRWKIYAIFLIVLSFIGASTLALGLTQSEVCVVGNPGCVPTGAHAKHSPTCSVCHKVAGTLSFDPAGPAVNASYAYPSFDATAKTCSNVACHTVAPGTFSYYIWSEDDQDVILKTVHYGGSAPLPTPSWYSTGQACIACHSNPPYPSTVEGPDTWHSSFHANNQSVGPINPNACELCHNSTAVPYGTWIPVALSSNISPPLAPAVVDGKYHGYQINPAATGQHANGAATVQAQFRSQCYNCH